MPFDIAADAIDDFYRVCAQDIPAVRHIRCADGIGHQQHPRFLLRMGKHAHHSWMHMNAVGYDLGKYSIVGEDLSHNAWIPMGKLPHGVKRMYRVAHAKSASSAGLFESSVR